MATIKGPALAKSSPHSSDEASHNDTPSTNLTAFSPESASTATGPRPKFNLVLAEPDSTSLNFAGNVVSPNDPFVNLTTPTSVRSQLSPTAEVFTPGQYIAPGFLPAPAANNNSHFSVGSAQTGFGGYPITHGRARYGAIGEHPNLTNLCNGMQSLCVDAPSQYVQNFRDATIAEGTFTTDDATTRAFMVTNIPPRSDFCRVAAQFPVSVYHSSTGINGTKLASQGMVIVGFTDYRDAKIAYANAQQDHPQWRLVRLTPKAFALNSEEAPFAGRVNVARVSDFEGQLVVSVFFNGRDDSIKAQPTFELLKQTLETFGKLKAFHSMPFQQGNVREIRFEYYDTRHAEIAARSLYNQTPLGPVTISVEHYKPDIHTQDNTRPSATGRSNVPFNDPAAAFSFSRSSYVSSPGNDRGRNGRYDMGGNHNQVEIYRIQLGLDVRTTIMLRNIPNKVNQAMLKRILDETSRGCYDFMYLRIDFANNCNVGYAFINFIDANAIIPFAITRAGQRWNAFNSDKVAEISYATIQGKDCLVQKFRNSSVMLECPTFRPKLFITGSGPDAGDEEPFPPPDNPSKMRRSVENAEHVGLFRPSSRRRNHTRRATATHVQNRQHLLPASGLRSATTAILDTRPLDSFTGIASLSLRIIGTPLKKVVTNSNPPIFVGLFAPRQGQLYREEQRRRRSTYDRGTPGAEFEAHTQQLTDPALSAYPSSSYPATMHTGHYDSPVYTHGKPGPSTWYHYDYDC